MQLITQIVMLRTAMPDNALEVTDKILKIASFQIIDTVKFDEIIYGL